MQKGLQKGLQKGWKVWCSDGMDKGRSDGFILELLQVTLFPTLGKGLCRHLP